jgi:hypothetical protein
MPGNTSLEDFEVLVRRTGMTLNAAQVQDLYSTWPLVERMLERLRNPARGREAEPAHIFRPEQG